MITHWINDDGTVVACLRLLGLNPGAPGRARAWSFNERIEVMAWVRDAPQRIVDLVGDLARAKGGGK